MTMVTLLQTTQYKKDLKRHKHDKEKMKALEEILISLTETGTVPEKNKPHMLSGNYKGHIECHVLNDFPLIWIDEKTNTIKLVRLGSHSELF